jgi:RNA polymerase sigma-70 factor (TIGR02943 family)
VSLRTITINEKSDIPYFYRMEENEASLFIKKCVKLYTSKLLSRALFKVTEKELAEDLVQDTFLAAFQSFYTFRRESEPQTWLFSILNNKIADHYRRKARSSIISFNYKEDVFFNEHGEWRPEAEPQPWNMDSHLLDDREFVKTLRACMHKLSSTGSSVMHLKYLEQKDGKEICQDLGITQSNFWQILSRAKLQVRACIEKNWFMK